MQSKRVNRIIPEEHEQADCRIVATCSNNLPVGNKALRCATRTHFSVLLNSPVGDTE